MKSNVILDFSHAFHACRFVALGMAKEDEEFIDTIAGLVQGKLRTLQRSLADLGVVEYDLVFAEDRVATRKLALMPGYRAGHANLNDEKREVKLCLKSKGCEGYWCSSEGNEADDTIASLVAMSQSNNIHSIVVTGDRDLWQMIGSTTAVYNPAKRQLVTTSDCYDAFQVGPEHIAIVKTLWGDAGDCVPNLLPRMKKKMLPVVTLSDGTFDDCHEHITNNKFLLTEKCWQRYQEQEQNARINYQLVRLDTDCQITWD